MLFRSGLVFTLEVLMLDSTKSTAKPASDEPAKANSGRCPPPHIHPDLAGRGGAAAHQLLRISAGHEREPHETLVSADIVPPAMNDRPIPPDARESSDLEPLSEASRPPVPSGALSCEKADRKNANAPLRILLYIIIAALPLFTYDTAGQNTALTLLCPVIILIILLHVLILWMVDIPIARAPRRWVRDAGGIALPEFWPFPLARQIGALLLS